MKTIFDMWEKESRHIRHKIFLVLLILALSAALFTGYKRVKALEEAPDTELLDVYT